MSLTTYRSKRDFHRTPEPRGIERAGRATRGSFVVQMHAARQLHYDFRLEHDGVLWSWAIPKGPSLDPADKRLAIHVEDHPLEYGAFEGIIPKGEYGGGAVLIWDRGTWSPRGDAAEGYAKGHLAFTLDGEKLKGGFALVRTRGSSYGSRPGKETWLLIKESDADARRGGGAIVDDAPDSVASARSIDEISRSRGRAPRTPSATKAATSAPAAKSVKAAKPTKEDARAVQRPATRRETSARAAEIAAGGVRTPMPRALQPMLATLVKDAPAGDDWVHEIKYDGYRMLARVEFGRARLYSRNGKDWTKVLAGVVHDLAHLPVRNAWIDGEVVVQDSDGRTRFQALQNALGGDSTKEISYLTFDLPYCDDHDLRSVALVERRQRLRELVGSGVGRIRISPEVQGSGREFLRQACALHLEGAMAKKASSRYASGKRSRDWLKIKCVQRQEMVIGGYTDPQGSRTGFGALLLGVYDKGTLRYSGKVGTGFNEATLRELAPELARRRQKTTAFANPPRGYEAKGAHWITPELVAEVTFTEWSDDGALRHPSFQGLRPDKDPRQVTRERPMPTTPKRRPTVAASRAPGGSTTVSGRRTAGGAGVADTVAGVTLSHPDKVYFPEAGITKRELAAYYAAVAPLLVPHIERRPLSLVRCPDGWQGQCFYQKHSDRSVHAAVARVEVPVASRSATYFAANSAAAIAGLVQWGVIELHPWASRAPRFDRPDRIIFDFDPDQDLPWRDLAVGVELLHSLLGELGLTGFLKTTGGKGLHVVLPVRATMSWDEAKSFARGVADFLVRTFPERFTAKLTKDRRKGRIFIDYLRNAQGATAVAPYVVRARANAPVATPIAWSELDRDVRFAFFNLRNVPARLARLRSDPWAEFFATRQSVTTSIRKRFN